MSMLNILDVRNNLFRALTTCELNSDLKMTFVGGAGVACVVSSGIVPSVEATTKVPESKNHHTFAFLIKIMVRCN